MEISWTAPEYMHTHKSSDWYWIVGIIAVTILVISILLGDTLFGVFVVFAAFVLSMYASRPPQIVTVTLTHKGIKIKDLFYPYHSLDSFWVEEYELHPRLLLKSEKRWSPYIIVLLGAEVTADEVQETLRHYLPEEKHSEPFLEKLLIRLGF